jgi:hypothetical protein
MSRGGVSRTKTKCVRPGIMPSLFGRHLLDKAVFLSLDEVAANLPDLNEIVVPVEMDDELAPCYRTIESELKDAINSMIRRGDRRLLGAMLQTLLAYPDHPFGWDCVGYYDRAERGGRDAFIPVTWPENLSPAVFRPKEEKLVELVEQELGQGRQCWVYVQMTDKRDVAERLCEMFAMRGMRSQVLRATVPLARREAWIAEHGAKADVIISHPKLVETGLDLFDKNGNHNFPTLLFYEMGYNSFTLRQASRRSWRIGQTEQCNVFYLYYAGTMQQRAMALMGKKIAAAQALDGKFSTEGLAAMAGDDGGSMEMALAKSLAEQIDEGDAQRAWAKVGQIDREVSNDDFEHGCESPRDESLVLFSEARRLARLLNDRHFRKTLLPGSAPLRPAAVSFQASRDGLVLHAQSLHVAVEYELSGKFAPEQLAIPIDALERFEGKDDSPVMLESASDKVVARWTDGGVPQEAEVDAVNPESLLEFPGRPDAWASNSGNLLRALCDASESADQSGVRYALHMVQLRGKTGAVVGTDGRQLFIQSGFSLPFAYDVLVPRVPFFGCREFAGDSPVEIGQSDKYVAVRIDPWTFHLRLDKESRFPRVESIIPDANAALTTVRVAPEDAEFLAQSLPRLPGADEPDAPVTIDCNGRVAVRAVGNGQKVPTEVALTHSEFSGQAIGCASNRKYLAQALSFGFREFRLFGYVRESVSGAQPA